MFGLTLFKVLKIQLLDKLGQGQFPELLFRISESAELLRIQPQFPGHLDMGMGKMEARPRIDPGLVLLRYLPLRNASPI